MRNRLTSIACAAVVICALIPRGTVTAQVAAGRAPATAWSTGTINLGIANFQCDCTLSSGSGNTPRRFQFRSEPRILSLVRGGASDGILERGDYITHIEGVSILTADGARRLAEVKAGDDVDLTVRRNGRTIKVSLHASDPPSNVYIGAPEAAGGYSVDWDYPPGAPTPALAPTPPGTWVGVVTPRPARPTRPADAPRTPVWGAIPTTPATPVAPGVWTAAPAASPRGWFGFSIRCNGCGWSTTSRDEAPVWESDEAPELSRVSAESPAGRAGLRAGDRITHIDGVSIVSREGGRRFGAVMPGQRVRLTVRRGSATFVRELTLATRPELRAAIAAAAPRAPAPPSMRRELRYTGQLDNVSVEVWSAGGPTVERNGDTIVITVGASVVRIKVDPKK